MFVNLNVIGFVALYASLKTYLLYFPVFPDFIVLFLVSYIFVKKANINFTLFFKL